MHLLAVAPEQRGSGLSESLVQAALAQMRALGLSKMGLWTQPTMASAQRLYPVAGLSAILRATFSRGDRQFLVFQIDLSIASTISSGTSS